MCLGRDEFNSLAGAWLKFSESVRALSEERDKALSSIDNSNDFRTVIAGSVPAPLLTAMVKPVTNPINKPAPYILPSPYLIRSDGAELPLEGDILNLGRAPENHIVVNDKLVSRRHSVLKREGLVLDRRAGRWVYYRIEPQALGARLKALAALLDLQHVDRRAVPCAEDGAP